MKTEEKFDLENVETDKTVEIQEEEMKSIAGGQYYTDTRPFAAPPCTFEHAH